MTGRGTQYHGLVDEVLGHRLGLIILKVFPNLVHSMCDSVSPNITDRSKPGQHRRETNVTSMNNYSPTAPYLLRPRAQVHVVSSNLMHKSIAFSNPFSSSKFFHCAAPGMKLSFPKQVVLFQLVKMLIPGTYFSKLKAKS